MKLQDIYKYSWFANLAYVLWENDAIGSSPEQGSKALFYANFEDFERVPGVAIGMVDTLGEKIFLDPSGGGLGWRLINCSDKNSPATASTGFSASLFSKVGTNEKVLAIRGTNPTSSPPKEFWNDLVSADITQIGVIGMALTQAISMVNGQCNSGQAPIELNLAHAVQHRTGAN